MYNLSIEVDNQSVSSGNVDVEGTNFYGCGCQASGQCGAVIGYWDDDMLTVLLSDEGCDSSEGQILGGGGIYEFEEVGSGSLNGDNSFGLSENGVQAYVTYLIHEGDDVVASDRQSIDATVRFVPVIEEVVPEEQAANVEGEQEVPGPEDEDARSQEIEAAKADEVQPELESRDEVPGGAALSDGEEDQELGSSELEVTEEVEAEEDEEDQGLGSSDQELGVVLGDAERREADASLEELSGSEEQQENGSQSQVEGLAAAVLEDSEGGEEVLEVGVSNPEDELSEEDNGEEDEESESSDPEVALEGEAEEADSDQLE